MKSNIYLYLKHVLFCVAIFYFSNSFAQTYTPVPVKGFNMDIIAEGTGNSSLAVTTDTMDQSNHVVCSQEFATTNVFTTVPFGLPNNGTIVSGTRTYQLQTYTDSNALNVYTSQTDTLILVNPANYTNISIAAIATENDATINIVFNFSDGTSQSANNILIPDWCTGNGKATAILQSYGRLRRSDAPLSYSDASNGEPEIFSFDYTLPCSKTLVSISFKNVSSNVISKVTRAFILAVSGVGTSSIVAPILNKDTLCKAGIANLTVLNPQAGLTYNWYNSVSGSTLLTTGTSYSPIVFTTSSYYVQAVNSAGCTSQMIGDTIILGPTPVVPTVNSPVNSCSGSLPLTVTNPQAGLTYQWYSASSGGVLLGTGNPFNSPSFTGDTSFYVESVNGGGCESKRTQLKVIVLSPIGAINGTNVVCQGKQITFSDTTLSGNWGITNNVNASINSSGIVTGINSGLDTVLYTRITAGGCKDTAVFPFTINPLPVIAAIGGNPGVCIGKNTQLTETTTGGTWVNTNTSIATIDNTGLVNGIASGTVTVRYIVTDKNGCTDSVPLNVVVKKPSTSSTPISICSSSLPYTWNGNQYNTGGTYLIHLNNAVNCDSAATLVLSIKQPSVSTTNASVCASALPYTWNGNQYNTGGTYIVHLNNAVNCDSAATLVLSVKQPSVSTTNTSVCSSALPYTWNGNNYNTAGTYTVHLNNAVNCDSAATLVLTVKPTSTSTTNATVCSNLLPYTWNGNNYNVTGNYVIHLQNAAGCDSAATLALTVDDFTFNLLVSPTSTLTNPLATGTTLIAQITSASTISSSVWEPSSLFVNNLSSQKIVIPDTASTFTLIVTATSQDGCVATDSSTVYINPLNVVYIPNALAPSVAGNPNISTLKIYGTYVKSAVLRIYNQWGQLIKELNDPTTTGWDGTYDGKPQPTGVYVYVAKITYLNNKTETRSGSINLIR